MRWLALLVVAACGSSPSPGSPRTANGKTVAEMCQAENVQQGDARTLFRRCPHWRMAMPDACGSSAQPSFMDPCTCMCDLCETDSECGGGKCLDIASTMYGSPSQKTCVRVGEPCFPDGKCPGKQVCRNYDGRATCDTIPPEPD